MSNSLGFYSESHRKRRVGNVTILEPVESEIQNEKKKMYLYIGLSLLVVSFALFLGINYIPSHLLYDSENYKQVVNLLSAMLKWIYSNFLFVFLTWLLPIPFVLFIPLKYTEVLLKPTSVVFLSIMYISILIPGQGNEFIKFLSNTPEASYMWYDYVTIILATFITQPSSFFLIFLGPIACVTFGEYTTQKNFIYYILLSIASIFFIIQVSHVFINENKEFFLLGYFTDSIFALFLQTGMIIVWVRCFHLVCRDCFNTFKKYNEKKYRLLSVVWLFAGTGLVEIWVSAAWSLHLAYSSFMKLEKESGLSQQPWEFIYTKIKHLKNKCCMIRL